MNKQVLPGSMATITEVSSNQSINERETDRLNRASCGAAALGNTMLTCCSVSDNKNLHMRECHCKRRGQYTPTRAESRETPTTQREQQREREEQQHNQSIDLSRDQPQHPTKPTNQLINQPTKPIMIFDVSLGSMVHSIEIDLIRS